MTTTPPAEVKTCADCRVEFTRAPDQSDHSWRRPLYCHTCGLKHSRGSTRGPVNRPAPHAPASFVAPVGLAKDWRHRAICRDEEPELFFPVGTSGPALLQIAEAKTVCRRCPVVSECLTWALESGQDAGVWGAMSEDERRALKRRQYRTRARSA